MLEKRCISFAGFHEHADLAGSAARDFINLHGRFWMHPEQIVLALSIQWQPIPLMMQALDSVQEQNLQMPLLNRVAFRFFITSPRIHQPPRINRTPGP